MRELHGTQSHSGEPSAFTSFVLKHLAPDARRFFIREADMEKVSRKSTKSWHLWLFNDYLICGSTLDNGNYHFERRLSILTCSISLFQSSVYLNAIELSDGGKAFVVSASSKNDQMEWLGLIMNASASLRSNPTTMIESLKGESNLQSAVAAPIRRNSWGIDVGDGDIGQSLVGRGIVHDTHISCTLCDQIFGTFKYRHECTDCGTSVCVICSSEKKGMKGMTEIARTCDGCWMPTADDGLISNTGEKALMIANHDNSHNYRPIDSSSSTMALFGAMNVSLLNKGLKKGMRGSTLTTPPPTPPRPQISSQNIASLSPKGPSPIKPPRQRKQGTSYPAITTLEDSTSSIHSSFEFNMASGNFSSYVSTCVSMESIVTDTSSAFSSSVYAETSSCTTTGQFTVNTTSKSSSVFGCNKSDHLPTPSSGGFEPTSVREIYTPPRRAGFLEDEDRINNDTMNLVDTAQYGSHTSLDHSEWDAPVFVPTSPPISAHVHSAIPSVQVSESPCSLSAEDNDRPIPALIVSPIATSQRLALESERHNISTIPHLLSHASPPLPPKSTRSFEAGSTLSSSFGETSPMFVANQKRRGSIKKLVEVSDILSYAPKVEEVILQCSTPSLSLNSPSRREISPFRSDLSSSITEREPQVDKVTEILNHRVIEKPVMLPPPPSSFSATSHTSASAAGKFPKSCQQSHAGSTIKSHPTNSEPKPIPIKFGREDSKRASQSQSSPTINQDTPLAWQKVMLSPPGPRLTLVERRISQFNSPSATTMSPASSAADRMSTKMKCSPVRTIPHNSKIPSKDVSNRTTESEREMDREMQTESTVYALDVDAATHASNDQLLDHDVDASTDVESKKPQLILSNDTRLSTDPAELIDLTQSNKSARSIGPILSSSIKELNVSVPQQNMRESVLEVRCEEEKTPARSRYLAHIETASNEKEKMKEKEKAYGKPGLLSEALKEKVRVLTAVAVVARKWENTSAPLNNFPTESMVCLVSEDGPVSTSSNLPISSTSNVSYEKYDFMRGMKISERTVRLMMLADGLHSSEIQAYSPMDSVSA